MSRNPYPISYLWVRKTPKHILGHLPIHSGVTDISNSFNKTHFCKLFHVEKPICHLEGVIGHTKDYHFMAIGKFIIPKLLIPFFMSAITHL